MQGTTLTITTQLSALYTWTDGSWQFPSGMMFDQPSVQNVLPGTKYAIIL